MDFFDIYEEQKQNELKGAVHSPDESIKHAILASNYHVRIGDEKLTADQVKEYMEKCRAEVTPCVRRMA